jgi:hypothetical protein
MIPLNFDREEVAEIRIIASYIHRYRERGRFIYVGPSDAVDDVLERLLAQMVRRKAA